jgi:hypothetical protein
MSWAIRLTWPDGRQRYEAENRYELTQDLDDAGLYPSRRQAIERLSAYRDARLIWGIVAEEMSIEKLATR